MTRQNPKCTSFCTGSQDGAKGHPVTSEDDIGRMLGQLAAMGIRAQPPEAAVHALYRKGHGYHAIADALGISHEDGYKIIAGQERG